MVNVPELRKALEYLTAHPEEHHQTGWFHEKPNVDGSMKYVGCLAGMTAYRAGFVGGRTEIFWNGTEQRWTSLGSWYYPVTGDSWHTLGMKMFGLTNEEACELFDGSNTIAHLWQIAHVLSDGEIEVPMEVSA